MANRKKRFVDMIVVDPFTVQFCIGQILRAWVVRQVLFENFLVQ